MGFETHLDSFWAAWSVVPALNTRGKTSFRLACFSSSLFTTKCCAVLAHAVLSPALQLMLLLVCAVAGSNSAAFSAAYFRAHVGWLDSRREVSIDQAANRTKLAASTTILLTHSSLNRQIAPPTLNPHSILSQPALCPFSSRSIPHSSRTHPAPSPHASRTKPVPSPRQARTYLRSYRPAYCKCMYVCPVRPSYDRPSQRFRRTA